MATFEINEKNFNETVKKGGILLIDWWAPWCGPCRAFGPIYERVSDKHPDVQFGKINTEQAQELAAAFEIRSIPTLMVLRDSVLIFAQPGMVPEKALEDLLRQVKALDMEKVKQEIEAQSKAGARAVA